MNIKGLADLRGKKNNKEEKAKGRETYIGGESSGLAVEDNNLADKLVKTAQNSANANQAAPLSLDSNSLIITLYSNGFMVSNSEEFRPFTNPANQAILKELVEGRVPPELVANVKGDIQMGLIDKRSEVYEIPEVKKNPFDGEGMSIGSQCKKEMEVSDEKEEYDLTSEDKEKFIVMLKFPNGKKKKLIVNKSTSFVLILEAAKQISKSNSLKIFTVFPRKDITCETSTVDQLGIFDSTLNVEV